MISTIDRLAGIGCDISNRTEFLSVDLFYRYLSVLSDDGRSLSQDAYEVSYLTDAVNIWEIVLSILEKDSMLFTIGLTCLHLASKAEDITIIPIHHLLSCIHLPGTTVDDVVALERDVITRLGYSLTTVTIKDYCGLYLELQFNDIVDAISTRSDTPGYDSYFLDDMYDFLKKRIMCSNLDSLSKVQSIKQDVYCKSYRESLRMVLYLENLHSFLPSDLFLAYLLVLRTLTCVKQGGTYSLACILREKDNWLSALANIWPISWTVTTNECFLELSQCFFEVQADKLVGHREAFVHQFHALFLNRVFANP
jgi:hypothetical protein